LSERIEGGGGGFSKVIKKEKKIRLRKKGGKGQFVEVSSIKKHLSTKQKLAWFGGLWGGIRSTPPEADKRTTTRRSLGQSNQTRGRGKKRYLKSSVRTRWGKPLAGGMSGRTLIKEDPSCRGVSVRDVSKRGGVNQYSLGGQKGGC